jgi:hypothetical protein
MLRNGFVENPRSSFLLLSLMMTSPIEKLLLPYLSAQIIKNIDQKKRASIQCTSMDSRFPCVECVLLLV